jgi:D-alanine-D-alanine ligase
MNKKNIAIISGGFSGEAEVSIKGAKVVESNLDPNLYNIYTIYINDNNWFYQSVNGEKIYVDKNDFSLNIDGGKINFDCIFNVVHGTPGEDGKLQGYFELLGIPYTNSNLTTSAITFNKYITGILAGYYRVKVPKSILIKKNDKVRPDKIITKLSLPCFVKPNKGGSSIGVTKVEIKENLNSAIEKALGVDDEVLIEEFIEGTEISCGMIKHKKKIIAFPITEIVPKNDYFDYEAKYAEGKSEEITPARISKKIESKCKRQSVKLYKELGCKGMVRMDYIIKNIPHSTVQSLKNKEILYLLDINTVPGLSEASLIPKQATTAGIALKQLYNMVIDQALRY